MSTFEPGQELVGRYRVEDVLGRGGMGVVLRAVHVDLDTKVAIKVLYGPGAANPDITQRFLREAQAASKLKSEFVARVTDFGRLPDGQPFMVMELLVGEDFAAILDRGALDPTLAVDAALQAVAALAEAHASGIVHRDIKPSNLFRTSRPDGSLCVKVLDFGISKVEDSAARPALTQTGSALGTPFYMSPEQIRSPKDVDERTDVWSLGVVLYEMLAGKAPFEGEQIGELFAKILESDPEPLDSLRPGLPAGLAGAIRRCLEKDRAKRISSMRELAEQLAPFASAEGGLAAKRASVVGAEKSGGGSTQEATPAKTNPPNIELEATIDASSVSLGKEAARSTTAPTSKSDGGGEQTPKIPPSLAAPPSPSLLRGPRARLWLAAAALCASGIATFVILGKSGDDTKAVADPRSSGDALSGAPIPASASGPSVTPASATSPSVELLTAPAASSSGLPAAGSGAPPRAESSAATSASPSPLGSAPPSSSRPRQPATSAPNATAAPKPSSTTLW